MPKVILIAKKIFKLVILTFVLLIVSIGYQFSECAHIYWEDSVVKINGYDLNPSEIGSWNIDIHHRLNVQQGIFTLKKFICITKALIY